MSGFEWDEPTFFRENPRSGSLSSKSIDWDEFGAELDRKKAAEQVLVDALADGAVEVAQIYCGNDQGGSRRLLAKVVSTSAGLIAIDRKIKAHPNQLKSQGFALVEEGGGPMYPQLLADGRPLVVWCSSHGVWKADLGNLGHGQVPRLEQSLTTQDHTVVILPL